MSMLRYFLPNGGDILLNFTHTMDFFAEWKAADSENNFLYHLFWFLYYNNQFKMHNNFKQTKSKRTGQSPLKQVTLHYCNPWQARNDYVEQARSDHINRDHILLHQFIGKRNITGPINSGLAVSIINRSGIIKVPVILHFRLDFSACQKSTFKVVKWWPWVLPVCA